MILQHELERIANYPNLLLTPFSWEDLALKMQDLACHALGWREGQEPLPDLPHKEETCT